MSTELTKTNPATKFIFPLSESTFRTKFIEAKIISYIDDVKDRINLSLTNKAANTILSNQKINNIIPRTDFEYLFSEKFPYAHHLIEKAIKPAKEALKSTQDLEVKVIHYLANTYPNYYWKIFCGVFSNPKLQFLVPKTNKEYEEIRQNLLKGWEEEKEAANLKIQDCSSVISEDMDPKILELLGYSVESSGSQKSDPETEKLNQEIEINIEEKMNNKIKLNEFYRSVFKEDSKQTGINYIRNIVYEDNANQKNFCDHLINDIIPFLDKSERVKVILIDYLLTIREFFYEVDLLEYKHDKNIKIFKVDLYRESLDEYKLIIKNNLFILINDSDLLVQSQIDYVKKYYEITFSQFININEGIRIDQLLNIEKNIQKYIKYLDNSIKETQIESFKVEHDLKLKHSKDYLMITCAIKLYEIYADKYFIKDNESLKNHLNSTSMNLKIWQKLHTKCSNSDNCSKNEDIYFWSESNFHKFPKQVYEIIIIEQSLIIDNLKKIGLD